VGNVKVTSPWEFVSPDCDPVGTQGATGVTATLAPETGLPWLSTASIVIVTFCGQTGVIIVVAELVIAVIEVVTVDITVEVEVAVSTPPNGAKRRIVESGAGGQLIRVGASQATR
jgi:hypothetical protein